MQVCTGHPKARSSAQSGGLSRVCQRRDCLSRRAYAKGKGGKVKFVSEESVLSGWADRRRCTEALEAFGEKWPESGGHFEPVEVSELR